MDLELEYKKVTKFLLSIVGLLVSIDVITKLARFSFNIADNYGYWSLLDVDMENSFGNFYSSVALLFAAILLFMVANHKKLNLNLASYWYGLFFIFLLFAFDEAIDIHEVVSEHVHLGFSIQGPQGEAWLVPYLIFTIVFGLVYLKFLFKVPTFVRNGLIFAGIIYLIGVAGFEVFDEWYEKLYGNGLAHALLTTVEDTFEMVGIILLIRTVLYYIEQEIGVLTFSTKKV